MNEICNFSDRIDSIDVKWDNIADWVVENDIKDKAKNYIEKEINKQNSEYRIRDLISEIDNLLRRQDIERLNLEDEFKKARQEVINYSKNRRKEIAVDKSKFEENNSLSDLAYIDISLDDNWDVNKTKEELIKEKQDKVDEYRKEYRKMTFDRTNQIEKIRELEHQIKLLKNVDNIKESIKDEETWYWATLIEKDWNLTYCIRWTDTDSISNLLKDVEEDIKIWLHELDSNSLYESIKEWKLKSVVQLFKELFWWWKSQVQTMLDDYQRICRKYPWKDINITGHSLGWWLAQILSLMEPCKTTYTYNSPGMLNIMKHWEIICECINEDWWDIDFNCLNKCLTCIWWKSNDDLRNEPIYNVTWDILSSWLMTDHIWKSIDIRIDKESYLEHWIKENRENIRNAPDEVFIFSQSKEKDDISKKHNF